MRGSGNRQLVLVTDIVVVAVDVVVTYDAMDDVRLAGIGFGGQAFYVGREPAIDGIVACATSYGVIAKTAP